MTTLVSKPLVTIRRTRKYRVDPLVHIVRVDKERERPIKILCTNYWVQRSRVTPTNEHATCLGCIVKDRHDI